MIDDFDPNVSHLKPDEWASYCPMSSARCRQADGWQTHESRANARRAISSNLYRYGDERDAVMYRQDNGQWVERERWHWDNSPVSDDPADGTERTWVHTVVPEPDIAPISLNDAIVTALRIIEKTNAQDGFYNLWGMQMIDREKGLGYSTSALRVLCAYTGFEEGDI